MATKPVTPTTPATATPASIKATRVPKEFCQRGHPLSGPNLYLDKNKGRHCYTCRYGRTPPASRGQ